MNDNYNEIMSLNTGISTKRLLLRKFTIEDLEDVYSYASDGKTLEYLAWSGVKSVVDAKKVIEGQYNNPGYFAIELTEIKRCIGGIALLINAEHEKASFGYVLNREHWNKGIMTEALSAIMKFGFEELKLNRIESNHYVGNEASGKVMEKCGMMKEGIALMEVKIKGVFRDVIHYGIIREQWEKFIQNK